MADVEASQSSLLQMQEHAEVEVLEKQEAGMRVVEELRAARTNMDQTRADLGVQLLQVLKKLQELEVHAAHLQLQEEAVSEMLKLNAERVRQGRARVSAQVAVFEKRRNDLQQRVHALELLEDRGAALLDTISVVLSARSKAMADRNLHTLLLHHKTDSAIYLHADAMLRHHVQQEEEALVRIAELEALQANKCSGTSSSSILIQSHEHGHMASSALASQSPPLCCPGKRYHAQELEMELLRWERQKRCAREEVLEARELQQHFDRRCNTSAAAVVLQCNRLRRLSREGGSLLLRAGASLVCACVCVVCVCVCVCVHTYDTYIHKYIHTYICIRIYIRMIHAYIHACMNTYKHTYIHHTSYIHRSITWGHGPRSLDHDAITTVHTNTDHTMHAIYTC